MVKNKLHIIGCSFSTHSYFDLEPGDYPNDPTNYARIVAEKCNLEPVAHAREGQGNYFMYLKLQEILPSLKDKDMILVQLSDPARLRINVEGYGNVKLQELYSAPEHLLELTNVSKEKLTDFAHLYDSFFRDDELLHEIFLDAIITNCLTKNVHVNSIVLPFKDAHIYREKYKNFKRIIISTNPWDWFSKCDGSNIRFDHLNDEYHQECAEQIIHDIALKLGNNTV